MVLAMTPMRTAHVQRTIPAPIDAVFEAISDHARYSRFRGIQRSELLREGSPDPNGLGALRRIHSRPLRFDEEITVFEPPARMDYVIREVNFPFAHEGGSMVLDERPGGTHVDWTSTFGFPIRGLGTPLLLAMVPVANFAFASILRDVDRLLAASPSARPQTSAGV